MVTTEFGLPDGGSVDRDAPTRACARIARRLLTLVGLVLGFWLIGAALHSATANAAPSDPHKPGGLVGQVSHAADKVNTVVHHTAEHSETRAATTTVARTAGTLHGTAHRAAGDVRHAVAHPVRTGQHVVHSVVRPVVHSVVRPVAHTLVRPVVRHVVPTVGKAVDKVAPIEVATHRAHHVVPAGSTAHTVRPVTTADVATAGPRADAAVQPAASLDTHSSSLAAHVAFEVAPFSWSLDTVPPTSPHAPQPLPFSPGGSAAAGGPVSSGHENGATVPDRAAAHRVTGGQSVTTAGAQPLRTFEKRPGFSPD